MTTKTMTDQEKAEAVRDYAAQTCGSENFYRHWTKRLIHTDGVQFVAETCGAHWLVDLIVSHQTSSKVHREPFQVWTLRDAGSRGFVAECSDGNNNPIAHQRIEATDFPVELMPFKLWLEGDVLMLPQER